MKNLKLVVVCAGHGSISINVIIIGAPHSLTATGLNVVYNVRSTGLLSFSVVASQLVLRTNGWK